MCIIAEYFNGAKFESVHTTEWLEKREDVFVLTKEELEKVFEAGVGEGRERYQLFANTNRLDEDFNDWLNQQ